MRGSMVLTQLTKKIKETKRKILQTRTFFGLKSFILALNILLDIYAQSLPFESLTFWKLSSLQTSTASRTKQSRKTFL
jgi:hypothetical protein